MLLPCGGLLLLAVHLASLLAASHPLSERGLAQHAHVRHLTEGNTVDGLGLEGVRMHERPRVFVSLYVREQSQRQGWHRRRLRKPMCIREMHG